MQTALRLITEVQPVRVHMYRTRTHRMERTPSEIVCPPGTQN